MVMVIMMEDTDTVMVTQVTDKATITRMRKKAEIYYSVKYFEAVMTIVRNTGVTFEKSQNALFI